MMALVPWRSSDGSTSCLLHVVENGSASGDGDVNGDSAADSAASALADGSDFCIVLVDPRDNGCVRYGRDVVTALLTAPLPLKRRSRRARATGAGGGGSFSPLRPCICVLLNFLDAVLEEEDAMSRLREVSDMFAGLGGVKRPANERDEVSDRDASLLLSPSVLAFPASMVTCSGLPSLQNFMVLPGLRAMEQKASQALELVRRKHESACTHISLDADQAIMEALVGKGAVDPLRRLGERRSIIRTQTVRDSSSGEHKKKVRFDESRNATTKVTGSRNHSSVENRFDEERPPSREEVDAMKQRLEQAERGRRRRQRAIEASCRGGVAREEVASEESEGSRQPSVLSQGRRNVVREREPMASPGGIGGQSLRQQRLEQGQSAKQSPMDALEAFLAVDTDSQSDDNESLSGHSLASEGSDNGGPVVFDSDDDASGDVNVRTNKKSRSKHSLLAGTVKRDGEEKAHGVATDQRGSIGDDAPHESDKDEEGKNRVGLGREDCDMVCGTSKSLDSEREKLEQCDHGVFCQSTEEEKKDCSTDIDFAKERKKHEEEDTDDASTQELREELSEGTAVGVHHDESAVHDREEEQETQGLQSEDDESVGKIKTVPEANCGHDSPLGERSRPLPKIAKHDYVESSDDDDNYMIGEVRTQEAKYVPRDSNCKEIQEGENDEHEIDTATALNLERGSSGVSAAALAAIAAAEEEAMRTMAQEQTSVSGQAKREKKAMKSKKKKSKTKSAEATGEKRKKKKKKKKKKRQMEGLEEGAEAFDE